MRLAVLAAGTGLAFGAVMASGRVCLNSGSRRAAFAGDPTIVRIFAAGIATQLVLLPLLVALGVEPLERSVEAGVPTLLPVSQLVGGLTFGLVMALAGGCVTGILWKTGAGSVATAIAIAGFVVGELLTRGSLESVVASLDDAARPAESSLQGLTGIAYAPLALGLGVVALTLLGRRDRAGLRLGLGVGLVAGLAWVAADLSGYSYGLGFVGAAEDTRAAVATGGQLPFQLFLALGVVAGGSLAIRGPIRLPDRARTARALAGGVVMGFGANLAHGCNIGHGVAGLPLLSFGSLLAVGGMVLGAVVAWRYLLSPSPRLRGVERPEPDW